MCVCVCVCVYAQNGRAVLPDMNITDSSEAVLLGRKPPFRLVARANWQALTGGSGRLGPTNVCVRHAVSEGFVVATRRTRTAGKVCDTHVHTHKHTHTHTCL